MKILLLEQDKKLAAQVQQVLLSQGYVIDIATDWGFCWQLVELFEYDMILLDLVGLDVNAIKFCQRRRLTGDTIPILMIGIQDVGLYSDLALHSGATDYLTKPLAIETLLATIKLRVRENSYTHPSVIQWQDIKLKY